MLFVVACNEGIDDITAMAPGPDESAPIINITYPVEGTLIQVPELVASIDIKFEVTDDIEIGSISVKVDGGEIASYNNFKDYRRALEELTYDQVTNGAHTLSITANDLDGKSTTKTVNFEKAPPYTPLYDGEVFYMSFDNEYTEMISFQSATVVGNPGFAGTSIAQGEGVNAYKGAVDSYLEFPMEAIKSQEFSAAFWYYVDASPDRAGILTAGASADSRQQGFRLFREGSDSEQRIKLNVGTGTSDVWNDGDVIDATAGEWVHIAFTIAADKNTIFINGAEVRSSDMAGMVDWTGVEKLTIGSGGETFSYWNHKSDFSYIDELRIFDKALSAGELLTIINNDKPYEPKYAGETFYMPFEGNYMDMVSSNNADMVGAPGFDAGKKGQAYAGAADSYLTFPTDGLLGDEFSASFWMKINAEADRAGILVIGKEDVDNAEYPEKQNYRKSGFRFFREDAGGMQRFKLNAGAGEADSWFDGGSDADVDPTTGEWVHFAFTISGSECVVYIDGEVAKQGEFGGADWTDCDILSIMSGAPRFTGWSHLSDTGLMDELRLFNKALSQAEVQTIMDDEK